MKVSELRPCDSCSGSIAPIFYRVRIDLAMIRADAVNQFLGMHQFFGGRASAALVENFVSDAEAVTFAGDREPGLCTTALICQKCLLEGKLDLASVLERLSGADT